jgi:hypothetical protein
MRYVAEFYADGCAGTISFDSISALAQWAGFNGLHIASEPPARFGLFYPRHSDGSFLNDAETKALLQERPAPMELFPEEVVREMRVLRLCPRDDWPCP